MQPHDDSSSIRKGHIPSRLHHPPPPCGHDPHLRRTLASRQLRHRSASVYTEVTRVILVICVSMWNGGSGSQPTLSVPLYSTSDSYI